MKFNDALKKVFPKDGMMFAPRQGAKGCVVHAAAGGAPKEVPEGALAMVLNQMAAHPEIIASGDHRPPFWHFCFLFDQHPLSTWEEPLCRNLSPSVVTKPPVMVSAPVRRGEFLSLRVCLAEA